MVYKEDEVQSRRPENPTRGRHWKTYNHNWAERIIKVMENEKKKRERKLADTFEKRSQCRRTSDEVFEHAKAMVKKYVLEKKPHKPLDPDQWAIVEYALTRARDNKQCLILVHGKWGTGKTRTVDATLYGLKYMAISSTCMTGRISFPESSPRWI